MKHNAIFTTAAPTAASVVALFALTPMAFADVTADQVWQNWKDLAAGAGQSYTPGAEQRSGTTLTITNLEIASPSAEGSVVGTIPLIAFTENGDGSVSIVTSEEYSLRMEAKNVSGGLTTNTILIGQQGAVLTAKGTPEAINYDYTAAALTVHLRDFVIDGAPQEMDFNVVVNNPVANYAVIPGDLLNITTTMAAQSVVIQAKGTAQDEAGRYEATGQMNGLAGASTGALSQVAVANGFSEMLAKGFATETALSFDNGSLSVTNTAVDGAQSLFETAMTGGNIHVSMDRARVAYGVGAKGVTLRGTDAGLPMGLPEVSAAYDEASIEFLAPIAKATEPQDFTVNTRLRGLTVSEGVWALIDPAATLPRDPATLVIETSGKLLPLVDLTGTDAMTGATPPAQIHALDINAVQLTVGGAEFKGSGALTFDNTQPPMLGGVAPMPQGKLSLTLDGANGLLGKLVALGLVDQNITMTFGMMASMLARPGATPDSLTSEIEFTPAGITANGMPLPF